MCGIVGYLGASKCTPILLDGLRRLEYRGYDSAGLAVHTAEGIKLLRAAGKLRNLEEAVRSNPLEGSVGIGHTRWATHGAPSEVNAHPHVVGGVAVVHNGIIENHMPLREQLLAEGADIVSDTDTELVAHLIHREQSRTKDLESAVRAAVRELRGAYAIAVTSEKYPDEIAVARNASPLVIGRGEGEMFCGSDIPALLPYTREMIFLEDGDLAVLDRNGVKIVSLDGEVQERATRHIDWSPVMAEKGGYKHFMLKEICEQPRALEDTFRGRLDREHGDIVDDEVGIRASDASKFERVILLACGTSFYAAMVGRHLIEQLAGVAATIELASEFHSRGAVAGPRDLVIGVSQSGETIDTLAACKAAQEKGAAVLAIANVIGSAIPRMADASFYTHAGPEIGVASTKCFTAQLANLTMFAIWLGRRRGVLGETRTRDLVEGLARVPHQMDEAIEALKPQTLELARRFHESRDALFLGRGLSHPIALEGALKLKEISYIHAEGYAAGEMKHGPIALIDEHMPVIVVAPSDNTYERTLGNLQESKARGAKVIAIATAGDPNVAKLSDAVVEVPGAQEELSPFFTILPLQLFAYYVADLKGTDVDQPRNLAKTVTVE